MHIGGGNFFSVACFWYPSEVLTCFVFSKFWPVEHGRESKKGVNLTCHLLFQPSQIPPHQTQVAGKTPLHLSAQWGTPDVAVMLGYFSVDEKWWKWVSCSTSSSFKPEPLFSVHAKSMNVSNSWIWRLQTHEEPSSSHHPIIRLQISTDPFLPAEKINPKRFFLQQQKIQRLCWHHEHHWHSLQIF